MTDKIWIGWCESQHFLGERILKVFDNEQAAKDFYETTKDLFTYSEIWEEPIAKEVAFDEDEQDLIDRLTKLFDSCKSEVVDGEFVPMPDMGSMLGMLGGMMPEMPTEVPESATEDVPGEAESEVQDEV